MVMKLPKGIKFDKIRLAADGTWYHAGVEITHRRTLEYLNKQIRYRDGDYYLEGEKFPVPVMVEDVAFFVRDIAPRDAGFEIVLSDGSREELDITTIDVGPENRLYCKVKGRTVPARFERKVYYELMKSLTQREGYYGLEVGGRFYPVYSVAYDTAHQHGQVGEEAVGKRPVSRAAARKAKTKRPVKRKTVTKKAKKKPVGKKAAKKRPAKRQAVKPKKAAKRKPVKRKTAKTKRAQRTKRTRRKK